MTKAEIEKRAAGAGWKHTGVRSIDCDHCRAVAFALEIARAVREADAALLLKKAQRLAENPENAYVEPDTNAFIWTNKEAEWAAIELEEAADQIRAKLRDLEGPKL